MFPDGLHQNVLYSRHIFMTTQVARYSLPFSFFLFGNKKKSSLPFIKESVTSRVWFDGWRLGGLHQKSL